MRWSIKWVSLAALAALCGMYAPLPSGMHLDAATAAELSGSRDRYSHYSQAAAASIGTIGQGDAPALDEMVLDSNGRQQHWAAAPRLVVLTSVMDFHAGESSQYIGTSEQVTEDDTKHLVEDLTTALRVLTNGTFSQFASIEYENVPAAGSISVVRSQQIVVGRYAGVQRLAQTIGFGGRRAQRDGAIFGAAVILDSDFDRTSPMRRLLRTHELGHALGFNHVNSRQSIMNPRIGSEMTENDRQIATLAFQRPTLRPTK